MGVDISMGMGYGIHISKKALDMWLEENDPENDGYSALDDYLGSYPALTFEWPGNGWTGEENGWVVFAKDTRSHFEMGREAEAGVYRPGYPSLTVTSKEQLDSVAIAITGEKLPIEWLVTVGVS